MTLELIYDSKGNSTYDEKSVGCSMQSEKTEGDFTDSGDLSF